MKTIDTLSHGGQIRRLRELAEAILTQYELGNARISLLSRNENSVFQVVASPVVRRPLPVFEEGDEEEEYDEEGLEEEGEEEAKTEEPVLAFSQAVEPLERPLRSRYGLRLYTGTAANSMFILSELQWLNALRRDTGLGVPEPAPARNGLFLTELAVEDMPNPIRGVLFRWVDGRFVDAGLGPTHLERVGAFMARLHLHAKAFTPSPGFMRPRWDWQTIFGEKSILNPQYRARIGGFSLSAKQYGVLEAVAQKVEREIKNLPQDAENYGLIHSHLDQASYLFYKDEARAIDFKACCFGYYLFDIAGTLVGLLGKPGERTLRDAFFRGYTSMRALPAYDEDVLQVFISMRLIQRVNALLCSGEQHRGQAESLLSYVIRWMEKTA